MHQQIAYAAEEFLTPLARVVIKQLLEPEYKGSLGRIGAWADGYRKTPEGAYTDTWHYIDPSDNPPAYCNGKSSKVRIPQPGPMLGGRGASFEGATVTTRD